MNRQPFDVESLPPLIHIGRQGDGNVEVIEFDVSAWLAKWPGMVCQVLPTLPDERYHYPALCTLDGSILRWHVTAEDTTRYGTGRVEVRGLLGDIRKMSAFSYTSIEQTHIDPSAHTPEPARPWVDSVISAASSARLSEQSAASSAASAAAEKQRALQAADQAVSYANLSAQASEHAAGFAAAAEQAAGKAAGEAAREAADEAAREILKVSADAITPTVSGSIVTITDGAERPAVSLVTHIEPVQEGSGDPSPDNKWPISGWNSVTTWGAGKNLLPVNHISTSQQVAGLVEMAYLPAGNYMLSADVTKYPGDSATNTRVSCNIIYTDGHIETFSTEFDTGNTENDGVTRRKKCPVQIRADKKVQRIVYYLLDFSADGGARNAKAENAHFERGSAATTYEPYQGQTLTASLPETVYGGTLDWTSGEIVSDWKTANLGDYDWNYAGNGLFYTNALLTAADGLPGDNLVCSAYKTSKATSVELMEDLSIWSRNFALATNNVVIKNTAYTDPVELKAALAGVMIAYKTNVQRTIQLTPQQLTTLRGTNNVWSSTGDTTLTYIADTQMYIDQRIAALLANN